MGDGDSVESSEDEEDEDDDATLAEAIVTLREMEVMMDMFLLLTNSISYRLMSITVLPCLPEMRVDRWSSMLRTGWGGRWSRGRRRCGRRR